MRILLTNDDGIDSPAACTPSRPRCDALGDVDVAAPATNQTGVSRAITPAPTDRRRRGRPARRPRGVRRRAARRATASASPCSGSPSGPDLVVSGLEPRRQPRRRRLLLGHRRGRARGRLPRPARDRASRSRPRRHEDWYDDASFDYGFACAARARLAARSGARCPPGIDAERQRAGRDAGPLGVRLTRLGRRLYGPQLRPPATAEGGRRHYRLYGHAPPRPRRRGRHRPRRRRRGLRLGQPAAPRPLRRGRPRGARALELEDSRRPR